MNGTWTRVDIGGKAADVYEPAGVARPRLGVLHLHGIGLETLVDKPAFTRLFDELKLVCVCPHGQRSWWADRICPEFDPQLTPERHLLDNVLPFFERRWGLRPGSVGLQGISMGGQAALKRARTEGARFEDPLLDQFLSESRQRQLRMQAPQIEQRLGGGRIQPANLALVSTLLVLERGKVPALEAVDPIFDGVG